jgi:ATP-dependent Lon protease
LMTEDFFRLPEVPSEEFELPAMPLRDLVVFPTMVVPLFVGRDFSVRAIESALKRDRLILLVLQKEKNVEEPDKEGIYSMGVIAHIIRANSFGGGEAKNTRARHKEGTHKGLLQKGGPLLGFGQSYR